MKVLTQPPIKQQERGNGTNAGTPHGKRTRKASSIKNVRTDLAFAEWRSHRRNGKSGHAGMAGMPATLWG